MRKTMDELTRKRRKVTTPLDAFVLTNNKANLRGLFGIPLPATDVRSIQERLTFNPKMFRMQQTQPFCAYETTSDEILVPRCFGAKIRPSYTDSTHPGENIECEFEGLLRDEQYQSRACALKQMGSPPNCAMLVLPCGFGKTVVALSIISELKKKTIIVINKDFLLEQWKPRIQTFLPMCRVGVIKGKKQEIEDCEIVLATVQTIASRGALPLEEFGFLIVDEAHHMAARFFSKLFARVPCRYILGLTATPNRKDGCTPLLYMYMGDVAYEKVIHCTSDVQVHMYNHFNGTGKDILDREGHPLYALMKTRLVEDCNRNGLIINVTTAEYSKDRKIIILSERVNHLRHLFDEFKKRDLDVSLYIGETKQKERVLAEKSKLILGTYALAQEGLDIPSLDTLILATPMSDVTQAVGRILRECDGKKSPLVIDICDTASASFGRMASSRKTFYGKSGFVIHEPGTRSSAKSVCFF